MQYCLLKICARIIIALLTKGQLDGGTPLHQSYLSLCPHRPSHLVQAKTLFKPTGRLPRFTFSPFTRDPNLQQTKFTRDPNLHISKFTQNPNLHETKFTHDPNLHENLHKTRFTQTQIYTKPIFTRSQIYTNPNLHINRNSKEGQTYDIFLKSPWYEDLKNNSPECLACKHSFDQRSPT